MIDFPTIVSAGGLINNALNTLKSARELAKEVDGVEIKEKLLEVYDVLLELKAHTVALDDENRELRRQLVDKLAYIGPVPPFGYYYAANDESKEHPLCPRCYQSDPMKKSFLSSPQSWNGGLKRICHLCAYLIYEKPMEAQSAKIAGKGRMWPKGI